MRFGRLIGAAGLAGILLASPATFAVEPVRIATLGSDRFRQVSPVTAITYSPDGKQLTSGDGDAVQLWDAADGHRVRRVRIEGHQVRQLAFTADGRALYAATLADGQTYLCRLDPAAGRVRETRSVAAGRGLCAFGPGGLYLAVCDGPNRLTRVVESGTGKVVVSEPAEGDPFRAFGFRGDGQFVALGTENGRVRVFDLKTGKRLHDYRLDGIGIGDLAYSPDGKDLVATTNRAGVDWDEGRSGSGVTRFEAATGRARWTYASSVVRRLAFEADGSIRYYGTTGDWGWPTAWRWLDAATGKPLGQAMDTEAGPVAGRPDGRVLAVGSNSPIITRLNMWCERGGGLVFQWDLGTRKRLGPGSADPPEAVTDLRFSPDGSKVRGWARGWYEWDVRTGNQTQRGPSLPGRQALEATESADGRWFARDVSKGGGIQQVEVVDLRTGTVRELASRIGGYHGLRFLDDGRLVARSSDGLETFDPVTGNRLVHIKPEKEWNDRFALADDGTAVSFVMFEGHERFQVVRWDLASGRRLGEWIGRPPHPVAPREPSWAEDLSPGGRLLAVSFFCPGPGRPRQAALFQVATGRLVSSWTDRHQRPGLVFRSDQRVVACYSDRGRGVDVREVATGAVRRHIPVGQPVTGCALSPDGRLLAVATPPGPITLWDLISQPTGKWGDAKPATLWGTLATADAEAAFDVVRVLRTQPTEAVVFLKERMKRPVSPAADWVAARIRDLDASEFRQRERATADLAGVAEAVAPALRKAQATASAEAQERLKGLVTRADLLTSDKLRAIRACEVLEGLGTPEARALLAEWAKGAPGATLTREATESLEQLKGRTP